MWYWNILLLLQPLIGSGITTLCGANLNNKNKKWYQSLRQSPLTPPNIVFPIVWITLYILMGIASVLVYQKFKGQPQKFFLSFLLVFEIQLVFNYLWSVFFFKYKNPKAAMITIIFLLIFILILLFQTFQIDYWAFALLIPYALWVGFASYLNGYILEKNPIINK